MKPGGPVVLVSGGNRGIGFETCRALAERGARVLLGSRKHAEGERAAGLLAKSGSVEAVALDVTDPKSVAALKARVEREFGALDVLINNAGVYLDGGDDALRVPEKTIEAAWRVNVQGAWRLCQAFAPAMAKRGKGRIVNLSSGLGSLASMGGGQPSYRVSKAALNALTLVLADELKPSGVAVISLCPGWVATEMGGAGAPRSPASAGDAVAKAALDDARTGVFLRDGKEIAW
jgi:NAD(P)-dependent dehydrogenase (short-subunit alcohol dehydrogenase family)